MAGTELGECSLYAASATKTTLSEAITAFFAIAENASKETFAIFYAPHKCFLAKRNGKTFEVKESDFDLSRVFEARVFNEISEMRWLNDPNGNHAVALLSETQFVYDGKTLQKDEKVIGGLRQKYLFWGERVKLKEGEQNPSGWTKFGSARIGPYYIPITLKEGEEYAKFTAVEYLKTYEVGNVAVVDERLTGIEAYKGE